MEDSTLNNCHRLLEEMNPFENTSTSDDHRLPLEMFGDPSTTTGIHRLPEEILTMIITNLPLSDRRNTRLVCKRWSDVNNITQISRKEKFVCSESDDFDLVLQTIENSQRSILNVEFFCVNFGVINQERVVKFLKTCGWKIETLSFNYCNFTESTLGFVILYCDEMQSLSIRKSLDFSAQTQDLMSITALEALKKMNIRRNHLKLFELVALNHRLLSFNFLEVLLAIHPNLDDLIFLNVQLNRREIRSLLQEESKFTEEFQKILISHGCIRGTLLKRNMTSTFRESNGEVIVEENGQLEEILFMT